MTPIGGAEERIVLFVDLLGFASLTEAHELDLEAIKVFERPAGLTLEMVQRAMGNSLTKTFGGFHQSLKGAIDLAQMKHPLTAISFSDSAFIATANLYDATKLAIGLMQALLPQRIPIRMGIAAGSFAAVRFRSDVAADGGDHAAHFLGTGVVRSHQAETCGIKGLRILLHPSAEALLVEDVENPQIARQDSLRFVECSAEEADNPAGVRYEADYWRLGPKAEEKAWHGLQDMWRGAPEGAVKHYLATAQAIDRMRVGQGEVPLANLRRRTLPRRHARARSVRGKADR